MNHIIATCCPFLMYDVLVGDINIEEIQLTIGSIGDCDVYALLLNMAVEAYSTNSMEALRYFVAAMVQRISELNIRVHGLQSDIYLCELLQLYFLKLCLPEKIPSVKVRKLRQNMSLNLFELHQVTCIDQMIQKNERSLRSPLWDALRMLTALCKRFLKVTLIRSTHGRSEYTVSVRCDIGYADSYCIHAGILLYLQDMTRNDDKDIRTKHSLILNPLIDRNWIHTIRITILQAIAVLNRFSLDRVIISEWLHGTIGRYSQLNNPDLFCGQDVTLRIQSPAIIRCLDCGIKALVLKAGSEDDAVTVNVELLDTEIRKGKRYGAMEYSFSTSTAPLAGFTRSNTWVPFFNMIKILTLDAIPCQKTRYNIAKHPWWFK